jgi:hypothetical protein
MGANLPLSNLTIEAYMSTPATGLEMANSNQKVLASESNSAILDFPIYN